MVFSKAGSSFATSFAINGNQSECPTVRFFLSSQSEMAFAKFSGWTWKTFSHYTLPASSLTESLQRFLRQKGCSVRFGRNSTYSANPVAWANHKEDWNLAECPPSHLLPLQQPPGKRDTGGMCLQFRSLAFCLPLFLIRRQELPWGAKGSSELQWP